MDILFDLGNANNNTFKTELSIWSISVDHMCESLLLTITLQTNCHISVTIPDIFKMPASKRSSVFDHYDVPSDILSGSFKAKCKHCTKEMKGSGKSTRNLLNHIKVIIQCLFILATLGPGYLMGI